MTTAQSNLAGVGADGRRVAEQGQALLRTSQAIGPQNTQSAAAGMLGAYTPGAIAEAESRRVLDANAQANLGAARSGGALGLRNAVTANAQAGVAAAGDVAALRAQEERSLLEARVGQDNLDRAARIDAANTAQAQRLAAAQTGAGIAQTGLGLTAQSASTSGQLGLATQGQYLNQLAGVEESQLRADMDYEQRRQAEAQRRSNNMWQFAGRLFDVAGKAGSAAAGG